MNFCALSTRRIASNLLWRDGGLLRNPLVTLDDAGRIVSVEVCFEPDGMAHTEFWAGVLIADFPADYAAAFTHMQSRSDDLPLPELLNILALADAHQSDKTFVVISGLDYQTLRLTPQSGIQKLSDQIGR